MVVSAAFALMYPVSLSVSVGSTVPSLMVSVAIAMSIDYSLFLLSRFREEVARGASPTRAVELMMGAAGHTVLISGATLTLCFAGLTGLPIVMLRTMGIGAGGPPPATRAHRQSARPSACQRARPHRLHPASVPVPAAYSARQLPPPASSLRRQRHPPGHVPHGGPMPHGGSKPHGGSIPHGGSLVRTR